MVNTQNFFVWLWSFLQQVIIFGQELLTILTTNISINLLGYSLNFQIWHAVLGGGFLVFLVMALVKNLVPLA